MGSLGGASHAAGRCLGSVVLVALGAVGGFALYNITVFVLALMGLYTLSFGTGAFVALGVAAGGAAISAVMSRDAPADFTRPVRLVCSGLLGFLVVACVIAVVYVPELIAFWPHTWQATQ